MAPSFTLLGGVDFVCMVWLLSLGMFSIPNPTKLYVEPLKAAKKGALYCDAVFGETSCTRHTLRFLHAVKMQACLKKEVTSTPKHQSKSPSTMYSQCFMSSCMGGPSAVLWLLPLLLPPKAMPSLKQLKRRRMKPLALRDRRAHCQVHHGAAAARALNLHIHLDDTRRIGCVPPLHDVE